MSRARGSDGSPPRVPGGPAGPEANGPVPRRRHAVVGGLALSALALALSAARWASAPVAGVLGSEVVAVSGVAVAPALTGLAALAVAAALLLALAGPVLARIAGVVLALTGLGLALVPPAADARVALESAAADAVGTPELAGEVVTTAAPWGVSLTGCALVVLGLAVVVRAGTWSRVGRRYERPTAPTTAPSTGSATAPTNAVTTGSATVPTIPAAGPGAATGATSADVARAERERALDAWEALERGEDPTEPQPDEPHDPR